MEGNHLEMQGWLFEVFLGVDVWGVRSAKDAQPRNFSCNTLDAMDEADIFIPP
jgi:hypothetical protein